VIYRFNSPHCPAQSGTAVVVLLAILSMIIIGVLLSVASSSSLDIARQKQTAQALAQAKEALMAYAVAVSSDSLATRPGDLPCPDLNNDGHAELTCSSASKRIGRLPFKTLGLPDLRDADGERLWYALSTNFQRSTFNQCPTPGGTKCLNSETGGTITVRDATGLIIHDGTTLASDPNVAPTGAIAVVLSPGAVIKRFGEVAPQDRSCSGDANPTACELSGVCSSAATARCNPSNYLDIADTGLVPALGASEDNKDFADANKANGFIAGPIRNAQGDLVVNDTLIAVRYADLMPKLEQRIAREALACLRNYALANAGRYPWPAPVAADYTVFPLKDAAGTALGRLAQDLSATAAGGLGNTWPEHCPIGMQENQYKWWANWVNLVFVAVAPGYAADKTAPGCGTCLTLLPAAPGNAHVVVLVAGRPILLEVRGIGSPESSYLEDENRTGSSTLVFKQAAGSDTFNDTVVYQ
jgi:type II secretory pathway pseudopilin PulG